MGCIGNLLNIQIKAPKTITQVYLFTVLKSCIFKTFLLYTWHNTSTHNKYNSTVQFNTKKCMYNNFIYRQIYTYNHRNWQYFRRVTYSIKHIDSTFWSGKATISLMLEATMMLFMWWKVVIGLLFAPPHGIHIWHLNFGIEYNIKHHTQLTDRLFVLYYLWIWVCSNTHSKVFIKYKAPK